MLGVPSNLFVAATSNIWWCRSMSTRHEPSEIVDQDSAEHVFAYISSARSASASNSDRYGKSLIRECLGLKISFNGQSNSISRSGDTHSGDLSQSGPSAQWKYAAATSIPISVSLHGLLDRKTTTIRESRPVVIRSLPGSTAGRCMSAGRCRHGA